MSSSDASHVKEQVKVYVGVFIALSVFTILTVGVAQIHISNLVVAIGIGLLIALVKGTLVAAFFMHLNHEKSLIYSSLLLTVFFFLVCLLLPVFSYFGRASAGEEHLYALPVPEGGAAPAAEAHGGSDAATSEEPVEAAEPEGFTLGEDESAAESATLAGVVKWGGRVPPRTDLFSKMQGNKDCAAHPDHAGGGPVLSETLIVSAEGGLANAFVSISRGVRRSFDPSELPAPTPLDQRGCVYQPHAVGVMVGQSLEILNSDSTVHNVNMPGKYAKMNAPMNQGSAPIVQEFKRAEMIQVRCDVHPWMGAVIGIFDNPYFAITDENGRFEMPRKLKPGGYEVTIWHEMLKRPEKLKIQVAADESKELSISVSR